MFSSFSPAGLNCAEQLFFEKIQFWIPIISGRVDDYLRLRPIFSVWRAGKEYFTVIGKMVSAVSKSEVKFLLPE